MGENKLMIDNPDIAIWEALKQGDRESLGQLFRKYYEPLFRYGSKLTTRQFILEDCIQELFTELWQSKSKTEVRSVKAYLFKSLKYKLYRVLQQKTPAHLTEEQQELLFELSHDDFLVGQEEQKEKATRVLQALDKLSSRQKEIVYLKYYQELSYEEVTEVMNINYQVARNLLYQSIKSLREMLATLGPLLLLMYH